MVPHLYEHVVILHLYEHVVILHLYEHVVILQWQKVTKSCLLSRDWYRYRITGITKYIGLNAKQSD